MKIPSRSSLITFVALASTAGIAFGDQPPNVVSSDAVANTAMGSGALYSLTSGRGNTATGFAALGDNENGDMNTAIGAFALVNNTTGNSNTAIGYSTLYVNISGYQNTAQGTNALVSNTQGSRNVAVGYNALSDNSLGRGNTAIGTFAGTYTTGDDNINIANNGVAGESQTMRLGRQGTSGVEGSGIARTFIAGVNGVTTSRAGTMVVVDSKGQLGTISSSREVKENIHPMGSASERLLALRPVTFQYRQADDEGNKPIQFGLIAEEVAEVFPELVVYDDAGKPQTVGYHLLASLLLNEFQREHGVVEAQSVELAQLRKEMAVMAEAIERLERDRMVAAAH